MYPQHHILFGAIFASLLAAFSEAVTFQAAIIIFLASFLIDVDHYFLYLFETRDFSHKSFSRSYHFCVNMGKKFEKLKKSEVERIYLPQCWFHGIEFTLILFIASLFSNFFLFVLVGVLFHFSVDYAFTLYRIMKNPGQNIHFHPFVPTYEFIKTKNFRKI